MSEKISAIVATNKLNTIDNLYSNFYKQDYPNKELIIILNNNQFILENIKHHFLNDIRVKVFQLDEKKTLGECLNWGIQQAKGEYFAKMDDDDLYGCLYFTEQLTHLKKYNAQLVGKCAHFTYLERVNSLLFLQLKKNKPILKISTCSFLLGATLFFRKELIHLIPFRYLNNKEDKWFIQDCLDAKISVYCTSPYNYIRMRYRDKLRHTHKIGDIKKYFPFFILLKIKIIKSFLRRYSFDDVLKVGQE